MNTPHKTDCDVLFLGESYESYRVVNSALRPLGLSVMWASEVNAARFLVRTSHIGVVLCNARTLCRTTRDFLSWLDELPDGPARLVLTLPVMSSDPADLETNMYAYKRLMRAVVNQLRTERAQQQASLQTAA